MKPGDSTVLLMWCCPRDPRCPRLRGLSLRRLFDVKVKERSLYSTGSRALAWPVIAYDQRSITHFLEMGSGSTVICHFKLICTFGFGSRWDNISQFQFPVAIYYYQYIIRVISWVILYTLICISRCISLQVPGMGSGVLKKKKKCRIPNRTMCQRAPWDSVELPLGELSPGCVPFLPKHFSIIHQRAGDEGRAQEGGFGIHLAEVTN